VGRFAVSGLDRDRGAFKTPTLREVARTAPYMHDGSLPTLQAVVVFYASGGRDHPNKRAELRSFTLSDSETDALIAFLESLSSPASVGLRETH
jgi:cytochrome c peroxidase